MKKNIFWTTVLGIMVCLGGCQRRCFTRLDLCQGCPKGAKGAGGCCSSTKLRKADSPTYASMLSPNNEMSNEASQADYFQAPNTFPEKEEVGQENLGTLENDSQTPFPLPSPFSPTSEVQPETISMEKVAATQDRTKVALPPPAPQASQPEPEWIPGVQDKNVKSLPKENTPETLSLDAFPLTNVSPQEKKSMAQPVISPTEIKQISEASQVKGTSGSAPEFSHSSDYSTLTGQVQSWRGGWRLRYADIGSEDQYGGSVLLDIANSVLQEGKIIRVRGQLVPPVDRFTPSRFEVKSLDVLR